MTADGFRKVASVDVPNAAETNKSTTQTKPYDAAGEHFETVPVDQVKLGDVILVLPGETVPVDGELLSGVATLDLSNINGEPVPREVYAGARVLSGAVNGSTALTMRATQLAQDSQYQKILELVSSAQESRRPSSKPPMCWRCRSPFFRWRSPASRGPSQARHCDSHRCWFWPRPARC